MPVRAVRGGYQWGSSGKVYPSKAGAERQARAIFASGWREDATARRRAHRALSPTKRAESRYVLDLVGILGAIHRTALDVVMREHREDGFRQDVAAHNLSGAFMQKMFAYVQPRAQRAFNLMAADVERSGEQATSLLGIQPRHVVGLEGTIQHARDANIRLIRNAAQAYVDDVRQVIADPKNFGLRVEELRSLLEERGNVSKSRAQLIARDQTLKLNGQLIEHRARSAGLTKYVWSTSHDERVRPEHRELDGLTFSWDAPPTTNIVREERNHPGQDYQCRCIALPVLDDADDQPGDEPPAPPPEPEPSPSPLPATPERVSLGALGIPSDLDVAGTRTAESAIGRSGLRSYLEEHPLGRLIKTRSRMANGMYSFARVPDAPPATIALNTPRHFEEGFARAQARAQRLGRPLVMGDGETHTMSTLATCAKDMRERTMVHELSHHLHLNHRAPLPEALQREIHEAYDARVARDKTTREGRFVVSNYARSDHMEWFAETHTAFVYENDVLRAKDPNAWDLMRRVRRERGLP